MAEQAEQKPADLPEPPAALAERYERLVDDPAEAESDAEAVAILAVSVLGTDLASMHAWLSYLEGQARTLVLAEAPKITRLADVLRLRHTLSGEAVAAVLRAAPVIVVTGDHLGPFLAIAIPHHGPADVPHRLTGRSLSVDSSRSSKSDCDRSNMSFLPPSSIGQTSYHHSTRWQN